MTADKHSKPEPKPENNPSPDATNLTTLFHENTKLGTHRTSELHEHIADYARKPHPTGENQQLHPANKTITLPPTASRASFDQLVARRRTRRDFADKPATLDTLSRILFNTLGVTGKLTDDLGNIQFRLHAAPSAGALQPLEIRIAARHVIGLDPAIYRYLPPENALEHVPHPVDWNALAHASLHPELITRGALLLAFAADWRNMQSKYGDRAYRYVLLEAGHAAQNTLLTCAELKLAAVPIGGFLDHEVATAFGLAQSPLELLYLIAVGVPHR